MIRIRTVAKAALAVVLLGGGALGWRERPVDVRAIAVDQGPVRAEAAGTGTLESDLQVSMAFTMPGRILSIAVDQGDRVVAGQVLGTLDVTDVAQQISVASAGESLASSAITRAAADVARAKATLAAAKAELDRTTALVNSGASTGAQLDAAKEKYDRADAELKGANAAVVQAGSGVALAKQTTKLHAKKLVDGRLVSPIDGVVIRRSHEVGDVVGHGVTVLTIASLHKLRARAWIDETSLGALREGGPARVVLRSHPERSLLARVERIGLEADRQTHEVLVDVELLDRPARLAFGQRVDVFLGLETRARVTRVPQGYCDLATNVCLVERKGRVAHATVTFGLVGTEFIEVTSGLGAGEVILGAVTVDAPPPIGRRVRRVGS